MGKFVLNTTELRRQVREQNLTFTNETINEILESSINITEVLNWLFDDSVPADQLPSVIVERLCSSQTDDYLLQLPNADATRNLKKTLCATTAEEILMLVLDLREDLDIEALVGQVCVKFLYYCHYLPIKLTQN